jgi:hypothetical protein
MLHRLVMQEEGGSAAAGLQAVVKRLRAVRLIVPSQDEVVGQLGGVLGGAFTRETLQGLAGPRVEQP